MTLYNVKNNLQSADAYLASAEKQAASLGLSDEKRDIERARSAIDSALFEIDRKSGLTLKE